MYPTRRASSELAAQSYEGRLPKREPRANAHRETRLTLSLALSINRFLIGILYPAPLKNPASQTALITEILHFDALPRRPLAPGCASQPLLPDSSFAVIRSIDRVGGQRLSLSRNVKL